MNANNKIMCKIIMSFIVCILLYGCSSDKYITYGEYTQKYDKDSFYDFYDQHYYFFEKFDKTKLSNNGRTKIYRYEHTDGSEYYSVPVIFSAKNPYMVFTITVDKGSRETVEGLYGINLKTPIMRDGHKIYIDMDTDSIVYLTDERTIYLSYDDSDSSKPSEVNNQIIEKEIHFISANSNAFSS